VRHLAIGDIHGCITALRTLADYVPFGPTDLLITLGDYVDRGPGSRGVLDWLLEVHRRGKLVPLRGNHEVMMLLARDDALARDAWLGCGGDATLASYAEAGDPGRLDDVPDRHWDFLERETRAWYETKGHFFVHANASSGLPFEDQPDYMLYWEAFDDPMPHESGKVMVCGHTPQRSGRPRSIGHAICIDTRAYRAGWLTCLNVDSGGYWQANEAGETRRGVLDFEYD
jgi:serine/threonine protein phosphatase 1